MTGSAQRDFVVGRIEEFPPGRRIIDVAGRSVGIFNVEGALYAVANLCPHALAPICRGSLGDTFMPAARGDWVPARRGHILRCPYHRWEFDITTGESAMGVDRRRLLTFPVRVSDGSVVVTLRPRRAASGAP